MPGGQRQLEREFSAVFFQAVQFGGSADETLRSAAAGASDSGLVRVSITVRHQQGEWLADHLFAGPPEHVARGLVAGDRVAVAPGQDDGVGGRLHQRAELFFAFTHGALGLPTVGHVARDHDGVSDDGFFVVGIITDIEVAPVQRGHLEPFLVMHLFPFEALVEMGFDDVLKCFLSPKVRHCGVENFLAGLPVRPAVGIVDGLIAVIRADQCEEFARGVDDGLVTFPHLLGRLAPADFMAELAVGGGQFGGTVFQSLVQFPQRDVGFPETTVMRFERRKSLHEKIRHRLELPLVLSQSQAGQHRSDGRLVVKPGDIQNPQAFGDGLAPQLIRQVQRLLALRRQVILQGSGVKLRNLK